MAGRMMKRRVPPRLLDKRLRHRAEPVPGARMVWWLLVGSLLLAVDSSAQSHSYQFGVAKAKPGYILVGPTNTYSAWAGFGFDLGTDDRTNAPFYFSVAGPEGNY